MIKWLGYAPDADEKMPGVFTNCSNVVPTLKGFKGAPSPQTGELSPALAATCQGAAVIAKLDDTTRTFAGSGTKLYEASTTSWTDRTRASGGDYAAASNVRWRFAQFGNVSLAVAKSDTLQSSSSGAFANVSGAPKAAVVETVNNFVFLFNTNEATYSDSPNRWWCSALGDETDWTLSVATQCATGILVATSGSIKAGKRFGEGIIAYKSDSMYLGVYVGPPAIWEFRLIPGEVGALSQEVVVNIGTNADPRHLFMGKDDFYSFDGSRPVPLGDGRIKETVFGQIQRTKQELSVAAHDESKSLIYWYYPSSDSNILDSCVVYNYKTNSWGRADRDVQFAFSYITPANTYADVGDLYMTYGDMPSVSYGSAFLGANQPNIAIFNTSNVLQSMTGPSVSSSITTGDHGDDDVNTLLHRVKITYQSNPDSSQMVNFYKDDSGDADITDQTIQVGSDRFDLFREARWHRLRFDFSGDWEASGHRVGLRPAGSE